MNNCNAVQFRAIAGIKRINFDRMIPILREAEPIQKDRGGSKSELDMKNRLLMTLGANINHMLRWYWRARRTLKWPESALTQISLYLRHTY